MDILALARTLGSLLLVLALLAGALWLVKRHGPAATRAFRRDERRLVLIERLALDPRHSLYMIARDGGEMVVAIGPGGIVQLSPPDAEAFRQRDAAEAMAEAPAPDPCLAPSPAPDAPLRAAAADPAPDADRFAEVLGRIRAARDRVAADRCDEGRALHA